MRAVTLFFLLLTLGLPARAQAPESADISRLETSYIYPVVLGTGTYKVDGRRLTMLTVPLALTQSRVEEEGHELGIKWYIPVTVGFDEIDDTDWLEDIFTTELVTLSFMPGAEVTVPIGENWLLRPFGQFGAGHDFSTHETFILGAIGMRVLGKWELEDDWAVRWGGSFRFAGEYQFKSERSTGLTLFETGVDLRRDTNWIIKDHRLNMGGYYIFRSYQPHWTLGELEEDKIEINEVHEVGLSMGLAKPRKILGIYFSRLRIGYNFNSGLEGVTLGTEFPF